MAILDAGVFQEWIAAFDQHELAARRYGAAQDIGNSELIAYVRSQVDAAAGRLNAAVKALNAA